MFKAFLDVVSLLHGDNSELIFLVHPDEEVLGVVVEDTLDQYCFSHLRCGLINLILSLLDVGDVEIQKHVNERLFGNHKRNCVTYLGAFRALLAFI